MSKRIEYNKDGVELIYDLVDGQDEFSEFGIVARGYIHAPRKGDEALAILHKKLQCEADQRGTKVTHLAEPETPAGKNFFNRIRKHGMYGETVYVEGRRFYVEVFNPKK